MYIAEREENKQSWFTPLLELGYGFTIGLIGNAIALVCSLFWLIPGGVAYYFWPLMLLDFIVVFGVGLLQLVGFVCCLIDLTRRHTYQSWIRVALVGVGFVLNFMPTFIYFLITGTHGNGFV